jgi:hypothetical protein
MRRGVRQLKLQVSLAHGDFVSDHLGDPFADSPIASESGVEK